MTTVAPESTVVHENGAAGSTSSELADGDHQRGG